MYLQLQINEGDGWFALNTKMTVINRHGNVLDPKKELEHLRQQWVETVYPNAQFRVVKVNKP